MLEHLDVQRLVGYQLLQSLVLVFQQLQAFRLFRLHPTVLSTPAVVRRLAYLQRLQNP